MNPSMHRDMLGAWYTDGTQSHPYLGTGLADAGTGLTNGGGWTR